jgi:hypothetical protein
MEYCEGGHVNDLEYMRGHDISSDEVSTTKYKFID